QRSTTLLDLHSFPTRRSSDLGAFRNGAYADRLQQELLEQDFPAVTSQENGLYRVTVGTYPALDEAAAMERRLKQAGYQTVIVRRSEEHTSELQSRFDLVCRLL